MISYYATTPHRYTFQSFLDLWQPAMAPSATTVGYGELDLAASPAPGLHVLTDFERLTPDEVGLVARLRTALRDRPGHRVLGDPARWPDRHTLLARLHEAGVNDFRAWRVDEIGPQVRFPVFLRWADRHGGSVGAPVADQRALARRLAGLRARHPHERVERHLLVVERVEARSEDGLFRKYSVARLGDRYVPRHVVFGRHWVTKAVDVVTEETAAEEQRFLDDPPDLDVVAAVFDLAGVEFGRIDWGYAGGRLQVWEINSNPMLAPRFRHPGLREASQVRQAGLIREALEAQLPAEGADRKPWLPWRERRRWQRVVTASARSDADRPALEPAAAHA